MKTYKKSDDQLYVEECQSYLNSLEFTARCLENSIKECVSISNHSKELKKLFAEREALELRCIESHRRSLFNLKQRIITARKNLNKIQTKKEKR